MEHLASPFEKFFGFNPLIRVNLSGTCATTKILQCGEFGCYHIDISRKFKESPANVSDLTPADFTSRKIVIAQVKSGAARKRSPNEWVPIAYNYEIVEGSAKREKDWGHLLFIDLTRTRFLIVMIFPEECKCGNYSHHDYNTLTRYQADRLMSLATYIGYPDCSPDRVRATYVTQANNFKLDPLFLASTSALTPAEMRDRLANNQVPLYHITSDTYVPSLKASELEQIDNLRTQGPPGPPELREKVLRGKELEARPNVDSGFFKQKTSRQCSFCEEVKKRGELRICSRCKLVLYCGKECQRLAWPVHRTFCKMRSQPAEAGA